MNEYININSDNLAREHLCCAIADKKHEEGVLLKKEWLRERMKEGHLFRKLKVQGKVFIEFAPLDKAFIPVLGDNYLYIYCLWVAGSYKGKGYGNELLEYTINYAKEKKMNGGMFNYFKEKETFSFRKRLLY